MQIFDCVTARAPAARELYNDWKNLMSLLKGTWSFLEQTNNHCKTETLMAPSKIPGLKLKPWPMSFRYISPSASFSTATSRQIILYVHTELLNISWLMSRPIHAYPYSLITAPLRPDPQPISRRRQELSGRFNNWTHLAAMMAWISLTLVLKNNKERCCVGSTFACIWLLQFDCNTKRIRELKRCGYIFGWKLMFGATH